MAAANSLKLPVCTSLSQGAILAAVSAFGDMVLTTHELQDNILLPTALASHQGAAARVGSASVGQRCTAHLMHIKQFQSRASQGRPRGLEHRAELTFG